MAVRSALRGRTVIGASFQYRDFRILWAGLTCHSLGWGMENVTLGWLVLDRTDSPFMVGVAVSASMAPMFFLGILSGAIADRVDRRLFLRFIMFLLSGVAGLIALVILTDAFQVWQVIVLAAAIGCLRTFLNTISQAYTYDIVGHGYALNGMALTSIGFRIGGLIGSLIAGVVITWIGTGGQYVVVSGIYLVATGVLLMTRDPGQLALTQRQSVLRNLAGYVEQLRHNRTLLILMFLAAFTEVFGFTHQTVLPVFARDVLDVGSIGLGLMIGCTQLGGLTGLLFLAGLRGGSRKGLIMFAASTIFGLGQMATYVSENLVLFLLALFLINVCASIADTLYKTLMQANVPNEQRGRAMGSWAFSIGVAPVGHLGVAGMASIWSAPVALLINGSVLTAVSLSTAIGLPRIRRLE